MKQTTKLLLVSIFLWAFTAAQSHAQNYSDITIPVGVEKIAFEVGGANGGTVAIRDVFSNRLCEGYGGNGALTKASFKVGNNANDLNPGGIIRMIIGTKGRDIYKSAPFGVEKAAGAGGGGSALYYKAPLSNTWQMLVVSGGGGGGYVGMLGGFCINQSDGTRARFTQAGFSGLGAGIIVGGQGGDNGNGGGGGGLLGVEFASAGGGGAFSNGTTNLLCGAGMAGIVNGIPTGGAGGCNGSNGGGGFGGGGSGSLGGGGGGGYSGGGGGGEGFGGGGGGSFLSNFALLSFAVTQNTNSVGSISYNFFYSSCNGHSITSSIGNIVAPSCNGGNNGSATVNYTSTVPARTSFQWFPNTGATTNVAIGLSAGTYFCKIVVKSPDNIVCDSAIHTIVVPNRPVLQIVADSVAHLTCNGSNNGYIRYKVSGGTKPFSYSAGTIVNDSTMVLTGQTAGVKSVTVTDANGCTANINVTIKQPGVISNSRVYVNQNATGNNSGESWVNAFTDLQSALAMSKNCSGINEIWVAKGNYKPTTSNNRLASFNIENTVTIYGGFAGNETLLTQRNLGNNTTILSGNIGNPTLETDNCYHVVVCKDLSSSNDITTLNGLIIQDGYADSAFQFGVGSIRHYKGAGLYATLENTSKRNRIVLLNCVLRNNSAAGPTAIVNNANVDNSWITLRNSLLYNNKSITGFAAPVLTQERGPGAGMVNSRFEIINSTITQNNCGTNSVVGLTGENIKIVNSIIYGNTSGTTVEPGVEVTYSCVNGATVFVGIGNTNTNPQFSNGANPAGPDGKLMTDDDGLSLQSCSPLINIGNNGAATAGGITQDITGNPRVYNNISPDMGAYELQENAVTSIATLFVDANAAVGGDGASWTTAYQDLQDALTQAGNCTSIKEIWVAAGTYKPTTGVDVTKAFNMLSNVKIYGGFLIGDTALSQRNWKTNRSILSGEIGVQSSLADNSNHVISNTNISNALLDGFTIERGYAFGSNELSKGAGIYNNGVVNTKFENIYFNLNRANLGGAMYNINSPVTVTNCIFDGNSALGFGTGGAMYNNSSNLLVTNCVFNGNTSDVLTGGVHNIASTPQFRHCTFYRNNAFEATNGAAMRNDASNAVITNCIIWDNITGLSIENVNGALPLVSYSNIAQATGTFAGVANTNINPQFNNPTNLKGPDNTWFTEDDGLHLRNCVSTLLDVGTTISGIINDIIGVNRTIGANPAMGAYESNAIALSTLNAFANRLYVKPGGAGAQNGGGWNNAFAEVGEALRVAAQNPQIKEVWVAAGTYYPTYDYNYNACGNNSREKTFMVPDGLSLLGGFAGTETSVGQANPKSNITILSGNIGAINDITDNCFHVVMIKNTTTPTRLVGFTVTAGFIDGNTNVFIPGLGIAVWHSGGAGILIGLCSNQLTISNCIIRNNTAKNGTNSEAAGIHSFRSSPLIDKCIFLNNSNVNLGGGLFIKEGSPVVRNSVFIENYTKAQQNNGGAAIYALNTDDLQLENVVFEKNESSSPSSINVFGVLYLFNDTNTDLKNVLFKDNFSGVASVNKGTDLYAFSSTGLRISNLTSHNTGFPSPLTQALLQFSNTDTVTITNLIAYSNAGKRCIESSNGKLKLSYSNIDGPNVPAGEDMIAANPLFVNAADPDGADNTWFTADDGLRIPCSSPSANTGTLEGAPASDMLGITYLGNAKDMGVYESGDDINTGIALNSIGITKNVSGLTHFGECAGAILKIAPIAPFPLSGNTAVKLWNDILQAPKYVKRHFEIYSIDFIGSFFPPSAKVTFYFTQQDFDDFNAVNTVKLPIAPNDAAGKANLLIEKRSGVSSNLTGFPNTYSGAPTNIDPADSDIIWNATENRWEVSFDVAGFSGFWVKTQSASLPLKLLFFDGYANSTQHVLQWQTQNEVNVKHYIIERSTDGLRYATLNTLPGKLMALNSYQYFDDKGSSSLIYYRLKMVEQDGNFQYSNVVKLKNEKPSSVLIYPNPSNGLLKIHVSEKTLLGTIAQLQNNNGQLLLSIKLQNDITDFNINYLPRGVYILKLVNGTCFKIMKQ